MEPEDSLPCSQEPAVGPVPEPDESNPYLLILFHILDMFTANLLPNVSFLPEVFHFLLA